MRVILGTSPGSPVGGRIEFSEPRWVWFRDRSGYLVCTVTVALADDERAVEIEQIPPYVSDMVGSFEDMARHARGWSGVMPWESEYAEVKLDVRNPDGQSVFVDFLMRWPPKYEEEWSGSFAVSADALPRAAEAMHKLTGDDGGSRFITPNRAPTWQPL
jgi:hypothetical protein